MTTDASGPDPLFTSLNSLVLSGQLTVEEAQIAHDAVRRADRAPRFDQALIALGSGLMWTAVLISSLRTRGQGDIDWSNYAMGLAATLGLLGVAAAAFFLVTDQALKSNLMAWPGAFGALGAGLMIGVAMDDNETTLYAVGLVVVALSAAGYYLVRRGAFLVSAVVGLALLYAQLYDDAFGFDDLDGDNWAMTIAAVLAVFTIAVTAAGWFLPATRGLTGVLAGIVSVVGFAITLIALTLVSFLGGWFAFDEGRPKRDDTYDNDILVLLAIAAVLCAGWVWSATKTGHMGFRLLIVAMIAIVVPSAMTILATQHPTWWELIVGALGAAALGYAGMLALGKSRNPSAWF